MPTNQTGTLEALGVELAKVFQPFKERVDAGQILELMAELGVVLDEDLTSDPQFTTALTDISDKIGEMVTLVRALVDALSQDPIPESALDTSFELITLIAGMIEDIQTIVTKVEDYLAMPGNSVPDQAALLVMLGDFAKNLFDYLIINYIESVSTLLAAFLEFFGIIEETEINNPPTASLPTVTRKVLHLERVLTLFTNPASLLHDLYAWGPAPGTGIDSFTGAALFEKLGKILNALGWPAVYDANGGGAGVAELDFLVGTLEPRLGLVPKGFAIVFGEALGGAVTQVFSQDKWTLTFTFGGAITPNVEISIQPDGNVDFNTNGAPQFTGNASLEWVARDNVDSEPLLLFGSTGSSRLEAMEIRAYIGADFTTNGATTNGTFAVEAEIKDGKLVIKPGDPDGFLAKILPPDGFELDFDLLLGLSSEKGFYFKGSGTLEFDFPVNISIGPISILNLTIGATLGDPLSINLGADIKAELGPFTAIVENMGVKFLLTFPSDRNGNLGPVNLGIDFKPPTGVGMTLDCGAVKGGGYLMLDYDAGRYAGALELDFTGLFGFTAIGIITTKFPDGSEGFSLLLLINVTFGTPIALGFNFYLSGIGGLIGLHRTMNTEAIRKGVKDGSISNILFPENPIANITKIISDLEAIFPIKKDQFFLGIMARITWNTPALLTVEAGLAIEFPNPVKIAILGVIRLALPTPDQAIIKINVAFAGIIDFDKKLLSFDASIFDSRILTITLEGDMALRVSWGDQPDFLVSVGGFHPSYTPAPHLELLPMKRLTVNILSGNPSLVLTAYFAVTTNTIQFGAALDFSFKVSKFGIYGHLGFDVLIQFSPFRFIAGISASVEVRWGSTVLFSISLEFNLEGPSPWRAYGHGSFKILFIKIKVSFDKTWGEKKENSLPSTEVLPLLVAELNKDSNWIAKPSTQIAELVTLSAVASDPDTILVRPFGSMEVNQNVLPLDMTVQKFGNYKPLDISKATISKLTVNGHDYLDAELTDLKNSFAPSAFKELSDKDKLSSPSYEKQNSGVRLTTTDETVFDYSINRVVEYEVILSDYEEEVALGILSVNFDFFKGSVKGGAVGKSALSKAKKQAGQVADKFVGLSDDKYAVADVGTMKNAHADSLVFDSKSAADEYLKGVVASDPSMKGKIQLTPAFQLA